MAIDETPEVRVQYRLLIREPLSDGFKRIILEQIQNILLELKAYESDTVSAVHNSRKSFKMIRTALRLVRPYYGSEWFKAQNQIFRDQAANLSLLRDAHVMRETILAFMAEEKQPGLFQEFSGRVDEYVQFLENDIIGNHHLFTEIISALEFIALDIEKWPPMPDDIRILRPGIVNIYGNGLKNRLIALLNKSADDYHEWRKDAKNLQYIRQLLTDFWPSEVYESYEDLSELSALLGLVHDYAVLENKVAEWVNSEKMDMDKSEPIISFISQKKDSIQNEAEKLGEMIYSIPMVEYIHQFDLHWNNIV